MTRVAAFGISTVAPAGWDARLFRHDGGEPTLHLASFPLPPADGEFGTTATGRMPADAFFLSLTEYAAGESPGSGLFAGRPPRSLPLHEFGERTLLLARPAQRGLQRFFSVAGRDFCLYAVLSDGPRSGALLAAASASLRALSFET
jgi:hypothetical protein